MSDAPQTPSIANFEALRLRPGAVLQMQSTDEMSTNHSVRLIGAIQGKSILVTLPILNGKGIWMKTGQAYVIRGFTGKLAFAFETRVIMGRAHPFAYVHFSYPGTITSRAIRKSLRVKAGLRAMVTPRNGPQPLPVTMVDLSATGSMINSSASIGEIGDVINLAFSVAFENIAAELKISAIIRSVQKPEAGEGLHIGLEFDNVSHNDNLILRCFIHTIEAGEGKAGRAAQAG